jgi:curved DNA-binding protein CbpA
MKNDHYKILEVRRDASPEEIQRAYRSLALRHHPDRNPAPDAVSRMTAINEAWEVLGDAKRRREYDALLTRPILPPEFAASWRVVEDGPKTLVLENAREKVRIIFLERADNANVGSLSRQFPEFCVVLALRVEGPIGPTASAIDLVHSECYGAVLPDGPGASCRSLFAAFL